MIKTLDFALNQMKSRAPRPGVVKINVGSLDAFRRALERSTHTIIDASSHSFMYAGLSVSEIEVLPPNAFAICRDGEIIGIGRLDSGSSDGSGYQKTVQNDG